MALEKRIEKLEQKFGGDEKLSREEILKVAWGNFLATARGGKISAERIEVNSELDENVANWLNFLSESERSDEK